MSYSKMLVKNKVNELFLRSGMLLKIDSHLNCTYEKGAFNFRTFVIRDAGL